MASPVAFVGSNVVYVLEGGTTENNLHVLEGKVDEVGPLDGADFVVSLWAPDAEDLRILNEGGAIALKIIGGQPPVSIYTTMYEEES